jgi:hypothetical protein
VLFGVTLLGASAASTCGSIKLIRHIVIGKMLRRELAVKPWRAFGRLRPAARSSSLAGVCRDGARTTASRGGSGSAPAAPACRFDHAIACWMSSCPRLA